MRLQASSLAHGPRGRTAAPHAQALAQLRLPNLLTTPLIYSVGLPLVVLDVWITLYQWICFPIYGVARVPRGPYIVIDRHRLPYLNVVEKVNCVYCGYANGLLAYVREIASRTEQYWCPIKHGRRPRAPHTRYRRFAAYGNAGSYHRELPAFRRVLAHPRRFRGRPRPVR